MAKTPKDKHMTMDSHKDELKIVFVSYENAISTSIALPMELFKAAETLSRSRTFYSKDELTPKLTLHTVSIDGESKSTHAGLKISNNLSLTDINDADIIYLPALWRNPFPVIKRNRAVVDWLIDLHRNSEARLVGVGTGCCFLAEAGLLDGRIATTHWYFFDRFQKRYPQVNLQQNYFITQSDRLYCTGSVNTLADLSVHFLEEYYGPSVSSEVERHFFHDIRQNYKKLALVENLSQAQYDELILEAQAMMQESIYEVFDVNTLANRLGMSRRNFDRRFKAATGSTPLRHIQAQKMECARDLIKNSNLSINEIMYKVGYIDPSHFSSLFKQQHGTTPRQYRKTVRPKIFNVQ